MSIKYLVLSRSVTYVDSMKVVGVHDSSLQKFDLSEMTLEQTLQLKIWFFPIANTTSAEYKQLK